MLVALLSIKRTIFMNQIIAHLYNYTEVLINANMAGHQDDYI